MTKNTGHPGIGRQVRCRCAKPLLVVAAAISAMVATAVPAVTGAAAPLGHRSPDASATIFTFGREGSLLTRSLNLYNPNWVQFLTNVSLMQLAFPYPFSLSRYYPELAKSVRQSGASIIVTLQSGERWTDNKPVTSQDVVDAFLIDGVGGGNSVWVHLSSVVAPNPRQVVFTMKPGYPARQLIPDIDSIIPVPAAVYGKLLPPNLQTDLLADYDLYNQNPSAASSSSVGKRLAQLNQKIIDFNPSTLVSDGPYRLTSINTSEILLQKWDGFWAAKEFAIPTIRFVVLGSNDAVYPAMLNGEFDETLVGMPKLIIEQAERHRNLTVFQSGLSTTVTGLFFNTAKYPFNMTGVRQAIAEMINRQAFVSDVWGTFTHGAGGALPLEYPSPISPTVQDHTLTKAEIKTLNPYNYNLSAATAMLEKLGFTRTNGGWLMPNGQPFDATIVVPSGWSDNDLAAVYLATLLTGLGIRTQVSEPEYEQFYSDLTGGNFDLTYFWTSCCLITNPLQELTLPLENYDYSSSSEPGLGVGPVADIPGIGTVNIPQAIAQEASDVPTGTPEFARLVYDWVRWFNATLPVYDIAAQPDNLSVYNDSRFTDWPPLNSAIYETQTQGSQGVMILAMQEGYIRPR
jgi:peptide/nickel transport system substrate-binding protein